jgi:hypothetical protein
VVRHLFIVAMKGVELRIGNHVDVVAAVGGRRREPHTGADRLAP